MPSTTSPRRAWPDFSAAHFAAAIADYRARERRFGRIEAPLPLAATGG